MKTKKKGIPLDGRRKAKAYREGYEAGRRSAEAEFAGAPQVRQSRAELAGAIHALEEVLPEANWHIAKGRAVENEPLYGVLIFDGLKEIGGAEGNGDLADLIRQATEAAIYRNWSSPFETAPGDDEIILKIANVANTVGTLSGEPAMEIAGQIVSVLAANPEMIGEFLRTGGELIVEGRMNAEHGCLPFRAINGRIVSPAELRGRLGMAQ